MLHKRNSSSEEDSENFNFKKIDLDGSFGDSDDDSPDEDESPEEERRNSKNKKHSPTRKDHEHEQKSKAIKKNRQSAKVSRQKKKEYQEMLEQTVSQLEGQISKRKANIQNITCNILSKFQNTNKDKYKYLVKKMALSKKLLAITEELRKLKENNEENHLESSGHERKQSCKLQESQQVNSPASDFKSYDIQKDQNSKNIKHRRKKCEMLNEEEKVKHAQIVAEKEEHLEMAIQSYMYQFGVKGCMRSDIIQRCKHEWLQTLLQEIPQPTPEIFRGIQKMKTCLSRLQTKTKLIDFHVRQLKQRVKDKYVVQFILDRQFFVNNSADTIYKNSQLKTIYD